MTNFIELTLLEPWDWSEYFPDREGSLEETSITLEASKIIYFYDGSVSWAETKNSVASKGCGYIRLVGDVIHVAESKQQIKKLLGMS